MINNFYNESFVSEIWILLICYEWRVTIQLLQWKLLFCLCFLLWGRSWGDRLKLHIWMRTVLTLRTSHTERISSGRCIEKIFILGHERIRSIVLTRCDRETIHLSFSLEHFIFLINLLVLEDELEISLTSNLDIRRLFHDNLGFLFFLYFFLVFIFQDFSFV